MTLPMSLTELAPVAAMASAISLSISASPKLLRQIGLKDGDFAGFLVGQFRAPAFHILLDRLTALLHEFFDHGDDLRVVELDALIHLAPLDGGAQHAQRGHARLVLVAHGLLDVVFDFFLKAHRPRDG